MMDCMMVAINYCLLSVMYIV